MIGQRLSHYTVLAEIGSGGMGVVYRARDEHLNREVALKVLGRDLLRDEPSRRRFRIEAEALSRLSHANVATVHDFDSAGELDFLVMELIPGRTLADRLVCGPLAEPEVLDLGAQMAEGLVAAHAMGIVHRDLKPANLRITPEGRLKILDFGLARIHQDLAAASGPPLTQAQVLLGTPPYMAPEQVLGGPVDARTDVYAAGAVLYEAATGQLPFAPAPTPALMAAILHDTPRPPRRLASSVSRGLERLILRCLEKDPRRRPASARELLDALGALRAGRTPGTPIRLPRPGRVGLWGWAAGSIALAAVALLVALGPLGRGAGGGRIGSIAVLPLTNLSSDPAQEYFAEGMTDELITSLAQISSLRVISRASVQRYRGTRKPVPEIARELGVDAVLTGSVARDQGRVRVNAQLVAARGERTLWARSYQRDLRDVLALQGEVADQVSSEIRVQLTPAERARLSSARPVDPEAYALCLKGRQQWERRTPDGLRAAIRLFQQAVAADPGWSRPYSGLADAYGGLAIQSFVQPADVAPQARAAAAKALELDPGSSEAHTSMAAVLQNFDWDWAGAEREFRRALELNPGDSRAHQWLAALLGQLGRREESIREMRRAEQLDPLSSAVRLGVGGCYYYARRYDEAIRTYTRALTLDPGFVPLYRALAGAYERKGAEREAMDALARGALAARDTATAAGIRRAYAAGGKSAVVGAVAAAYERQRAAGYFPASRIAELYASIGRADEAMRWMETAFAERDVDLNRLRVDPIFDGLRRDPRFAALLGRMRFPVAPPA